MKKRYKYPAIFSMSNEIVASLHSQTIKEGIFEIFGSVCIYDSTWRGSRRVRSLAISLYTYNELCKEVIERLLK